MNNDLISRAALLEWLCEGCNGAKKVGCGSPCCDYDLIMQAPAVDAEPVRHGRWAHMGGDEWYCTVCTEVIHTEGSWEKPTDKYCHECGAKMDAEVTNG